MENSKLYLHCCGREQIVAFNQLYKLLDLAGDIPHEFKRFDSEYSFQLARCWWCDNYYIRKKNETHFSYRVIPGGDVIISR